MAQDDIVTSNVKKTAQDLKDAVTFKKQRQEISDAAKSVMDKVKSFLPKSDAPSATYTYDPKAVSPKPAAKTPSYKDGVDKVPKTGLAKLHKGEAVLNKEDAEEYREKKKGSSMSRAKSVMGGGKKKSGGKKPHSMHVRRGHSGGFVVTHHHQPDEHGMTPPSEDHVVPDLQSLQDHMQQNMGDQPPAAQAAPPMAGM